jgi:hypothetical protein
MCINEVDKAAMVEIEIDKTPENNYERLRGYADLVKTSMQQGNAE